MHYEKELKQDTRVKERGTTTSVGVREGCSCWSVFKTGKETKISHMWKGITEEGLDLFYMNPEASEPI